MVQVLDVNLSEHNLFLLAIRKLTLKCPLDVNKKRIMTFFEEGLGNY